MESDSPIFRHPSMARNFARADGSFLDRQNIRTREVWLPPMSRAWRCNFIYFGSGVTPNLLFLDGAVSTIARHRLQQHEDERPDRQTPRAFRGGGAMPGMQTGQTASPGGRTCGCGLRVADVDAAVVSTDTRATGRRNHSRCRRSGKPRRRPDVPAGVFLCPPAPLILNFLGGPAPVPLPVLGRLFVVFSQRPAAEQCVASVAIGTAMFQPSTTCDATMRETIADISFVASVSPANCRELRENQINWPGRRRHPVTRGVGEPVLAELLIGR